MSRADTAGLVPAIHVCFLRATAKSWMPASSAGMTGRGRCDEHSRPATTRDCARCCRPTCRFWRRFSAPAIGELAAEDYSEPQREAWASTADDEEEFGAKLAGALTLVATCWRFCLWGFASLVDNARIDMLYVHPAAAGKGAAARLLCDALEKLAAARVPQELTVDLSDTASGFFEKRFVAAKTRNTVTIGGEWLANTTMSKPLKNMPR